MSEIFSADLMGFFFGPLFNTDVAMSALSGHPDPVSLEEELIASIERSEVHTGIQLIGYENVDTGLSAAILMRNPHSPSMVSFFTESHHRLFGGTTLACVPFAFCSAFYKPEGDHLVYRHTFKEPNFKPHELEDIKKKGTPEQQVRAFAYTKSRDGYSTVPGMSYVGITKRTWQKRYFEHVEGAMQKASSTRFHEAIRRMQGWNVIHVHDVSAFGVSKQDAKC